MNNLQEILSQIPKLSGVYTYKDVNNNIIYIGKAKNLFNRVHSYFNKNTDLKTRTLVKKIDKIEYFVTNNEIEALLLENNLIKQFQPKYNIRLKDSKSFPLIKITKENLPRIVMCREKTNKKDEYFGPYIDSYKIKTILTIFKKYLKIRGCRKKFKSPYNYKPCLNYYIKRCYAPCASFITEEEYLKTIDIAKNILKGNTKPIIEMLTQKMWEHSQNERYERAAETRDQIKSISELETKQFVEMVNGDNSDFIGIFSDFNMASISLIKQRQGKIIGKENFILTNIIDYSTVLPDFLNAYYLNITEFPKHIFIPEKIDDAKILKDAINQKFNITVHIDFPQSPKDKKILQLSKQNAEIYFEEKQYKLDKIHSLRELKKVLNLTTLPRKIECFDIATLSGKFNTASMVTFTDGKPNKAEYRQFNIEGQGHPDDYLMMEEVIARRYQKLKNEKLPFPDLIVVDGGKGQVSSALNSLSVLDIDIPLIGLAKKFEHIFLPHKKSPLILPKESLALKLLQAIRDEAHRFSNIRLSKRYKNKTLQTKLLEIEGIGEKKATLLIKKFKSLKNIEIATIEEIAKVETIGENLAKKIYNFFHT
ncbi:MAG: excinuclease ABC subunit C [Spirochaetes bacterium GWD1_27_9]|nr:MAG: excinuclease ABC subunit C [Spirochaetes bacterium GWB1_27_13]OHD23401.1 MAG: excinuclease ABC subunit C [Spirochaetes bacterium GWC1_27_15]OHD43024.1 MAG: excinuclease ABC subunit C [Spirochaetes bacterium GWD1_27_9]